MSKESKVDLSKFKKGTTFKVQYYMVGFDGKVYNKYWVKKTYNPDFEFSKDYFTYFFESDKIEKYLEPLKFFVENNRIKLIKL